MSFKSFYKESMINKLLVINAAVYLLIALASLIMKLCGADLMWHAFSNRFLAMPAAPERLILSFWTPITYMFTHFDFMHILANMLWLFFMGKIFLITYNNKQTLGVYLLGGLCGALLYILCYNLIPGLHEARAICTCVGASAAVTAIVIACCVAQPNMEVRIFGLIPITLKWLGITYILLDLLMLRGENAGGHITHLGGAILGLIFAMRIRKGKDITNGLNKMIDWVVSKIPSKSSNSKMHVSYRNNYKSNATTHSAQQMSDGDFNQQKAEEQKRIDEILDKISKSGYNNLSKEEKEYLFKASKKK